MSGKPVYKMLQDEEETIINFCRFLMKEKQDTKCYITFIKLGYNF